jgi:hypothetical protein
VWTVDCPEGSKNFSSSETLRDAPYLEFVLDLKKRGFEIAFHNATMESSLRDRTLYALDRFEEIFGAAPTIHANHSYNRENLYWGVDRLDVRLLRWMYRYLNGKPADWYQGHHEGSPWWWGDLCMNRIEYVRNLTFARLNLETINPSMPYRDPRRPLCKYWFSASDAESVTEFNELLRPERVDELEEQGGYCIVATHLGKGFATAGAVHPVTRERLEHLARRDAWFPTTTELLNFLRSRRSGDDLPRGEWRRMQWMWARDLFARRLTMR